MNDFKQVNPEFKVNQRLLDKDNKKTSYTIKLIYFVNGKIYYEIEMRDNSWGCFSALLGDVQFDRFRVSEKKLKSWVIQ